MVKQDLNVAEYVEISSISHQLNKSVINDSSLLHELFNDQIIRIGDKIRLKNHKDYHDVIFVIKKIARQNKKRIKEKHFKNQRYLINYQTEIKYVGDFFTEKKEKTNDEFEKAINCLEQNPKRGIFILKNLIRKNPDTLEYSYYLSIAYFNHGDKNKGINLLSLLTEKYPESYLFDSLGKMYEVIGNIKEADYCFNKAKKLK